MPLRAFRLQISTKSDMNKDTLHTISQRTGSSVSTISRVLSGKGRQFRISERTIELITKEAEACNYIPDQIARGLKMKKTSTIGLTVPAIDNPFFANLASGLIAHLKKYGYNILLADTMEDERNEKDALMSFVARKVDGIVTVPVSSSPDLLERIAKSVPVVLIDRYFENTDLPYVCSDNYSGSFAATKYLIGKGYRRIHAIQGVLTSMPNKERVRGFLDAVASHADSGVTGTVSGNSFSLENGISETLRIMSGNDRPDAIFAFSTTILLGVISTLRRMSLSIPDDIAIISFDDNLFFDYMNPPITRVAQPVAEIGQLASDILLKMIDGSLERGEVCQMQIPPKLVHGESC